MLRIGIVGFGKMGRLRAEAIQEDGRGKVVAIADADLIEPLPDARIYSDAAELIASPDLDAVFICTPNCFNKPLTTAALRARKHVFCEKPPAFTAEEVRGIVAVEADSGGRKLMYGLNHRHHDSVRRAKELIDSGVYGRVLWMRGRYGKSVGPSFYKEWRAKKELAGGGIMLDQGIHMLDLFLLFAGDFEEVSAFVSNLYWQLEVEDNVFAIFRNRQGTVASLHSTMTQWRHLFSLEVFLEKGYIVLNGLLTSSGTYGDEILTIAKNRSAAPAATWNDEEHFKFDVNNSWLHEVRHFFDCILNDKPVQHGNSEQALKLMQLMDKIYATSNSRQE